jgi:hypothetical protein
MERDSVVPRGDTIAASVESRGRAKARTLLSALVLCAALTGCGSYASRAEKYLTEASSEVAGTAYVLERFGAGEVTGSFLRSSLEQYAKAMQSTSRSLQSLEPPPGARAEHGRAVAALSRARTLAQEAGREGVGPGEAAHLARRLRGLEEELEA